MDEYDKTQDACSKCGADGLEEVPGDDTKTHLAVECQGCGHKWLELDPQCGALDSTTQGRCSNLVEAEGFCAIHQEN